MAIIEKKKKFLKPPLSTGFESNTSFCTVLYENNTQSCDHTHNLVFVFTNV